MNDKPVEYNIGDRVTINADSDGIQWTIINVVKFTGANVVIYELRANELNSDNQFTKLANFRVANSAEVTRIYHQDKEREDRIYEDSTNPLYDIRIKVNTQLNQAVQDAKNSIAALTEFVRDVALYGRSSSDNVLYTSTKTIHAYLVSAQMLEDMEYKQKYTGLPYRDFSGAEKIGTNFAAFDLSFFNFTRASFIECDFSESSLKKADFSNARLYSCNMSNVKAHGAKFNSAVLKGNFTGADLSYSKMNNVHCSDSIPTDFSRAHLTSVSSENGDFSRCDFGHANMNMANFTSCNFTSCNFRGAYLHETKFDKCDLTGAFYDDKTQFPPRFKPEKHGMIKRENSAG